MRRLFSHALAASLAAAAISIAPPAMAGDTDATAPRSSLPSAEIVVVGDFPNADAVGARVTSWFVGQAIPAITSRAPALRADVVFAPREATGVRVWVLVPAPAQARLFFAVQERSGGEPRFLVQDVELNSGIDELGLERVAQVAYLSAVALWEGNAESSREEVERGLATPAAPPPAPSRKPVARPASTPKPVARWQVQGMTTFDARLHGPEGLLMGPFFGAGLGWNNGTDTRFTVEAGVRWFIDPNEPEEQGVGVDVQGFGYSITASYARALSEPIWLYTQLGPELQWIHYRTEAVDNPALSGEVGVGKSILRPGLFGSAGVGWRFKVGGMLTLGLSVNVPFVQKHYEIDDERAPGGRRELLSPWPIQPGLSLGVRY
jgi:hypothetical protein